MHASLLVSSLAALLLAAHLAHADHPAPYGQEPYGDDMYGRDPYGDDMRGRSPYGQRSRGRRPMPGGRKDRSCSQDRPNNYGGRPMSGGGDYPRGRRGRSMSRGGYGSRPMPGGYSGRSTSRGGRPTPGGYGDHPGYDGRPSSRGRPGYGDRPGHGSRYSSRGRPGYGSRSSSRGRPGYGSRYSSRGRRSRSSSRSSSSSRSRSRSHGRKGRRHGKRRGGKKGRCQKILKVTCDCDDAKKAYPGGASPAGDDGPCTTNGEMKCGRDGGFLTCDHNKWVHRQCAAGTLCRPFNNSILCDHAANANAPTCTQEGQNRCAASGSGFETCANGIWVSRTCNANTRCQMGAGNNVQCV